MKISVIMPVFNAERFLAEAIESILNQTYRDFELIIINDGSTDNSENIIMSYNDKRIKYVKNEENLKLIKTLNKGIELAHGDYIARMDSDDVSLPDRFERQINAFQKNPSIDFINGRAYDMNENGALSGKSWYGPVSPEAIRHICLFASIICHPSIMIKAALLKKYKYRDDDSVLHIEDYDLWIRLLLDGYKCFSMEQPVLKYRIVENSVCRTNGNETYEHLVYNIKKYCSKQGFPITKDDIATLYGWNNTYDGFWSLHKMFDRYVKMFFDKQTNEGELLEFIAWKNSRELRILHAMIKEKKFSSLLKVLLAMRMHIIEYVRYLVKMK